ncbi:hypothetical protein [Caulobacter mirabilis]|uniref:Uncharacterized protein n=1 Tax=Caulobacter mirabilis TaxID=69666 RepID=A0A2D2AYX6_9CAUL|nr:hypothetical protein [Caulobacter mirabilis]ATQ43127.1 hypothetical protein CSW64_12230 [Caulobacter mirabilis]
MPGPTREDVLKVFGGSAIEQPIANPAERHAAPSAAGLVEGDLPIPDILSPLTIPTVGEIDVQVLAGDNLDAISIAERSEPIVDPVIAEVISEAIGATIAVVTTELILPTPAGPIAPAIGAATGAAVGTAVKVALGDEVEVGPGTDPLLDPI